MAEMPLVGEEFAGYRLVSVLGRGGMSVVFRAENPRLGNVIALKVLDPSLANDDVFRTRFLEESRIAASMNHPNVIPIHDMGSSDGLLYIAMRYVTGTDLRQMLKKRGRLPAGDGGLPARAGGPGARRRAPPRPGPPRRQAGQPARRAGQRRRRPRARVPDRLRHHQAHGRDRTGLTSSGQFLGTIDYVAPEQIRGISVLGLADQYSLGCVLYECLTGRVPFEKDLDAAIIWAHVEESPTPPTMLRPDLPPAIDDVFARVLAKNPGDRFETCKDFMTAAREALGPMADPPPASGSAVDPPAQSGRRRLPGRGLSPSTAVDARYRRVGLPEAYPPTELAHEPADDSPRPPTASWPSVAATPPLPPATAGRRRRARARRPTARPAPGAAPRVAGGRGGARPGRRGHRGRGDDGPDGRPRQPVSRGRQTPAAGTSMAAGMPTSPAATGAAAPAARRASPFPRSRGRYRSGRPPASSRSRRTASSPTPPNPGAGVITVLNTATDQVSGTIKIPQGPPQFVSFSPDSRTAYVSVYNTRGSVHLVAFIDTATSTVTSTVPADNFTPGPSTTSPDGRFLYVPNHNMAMSGANENVVDVIDTASKTLIGTIAVPANPHWVVFGKNGRFYTSDHMSATRHGPQRQD